MKGAEAKKYHPLLLDVDGTLLDFHASERQGISRILMDYGFPASDELLEKYHQINDGYWQAFNRGEISKERLCRERFVRFFWGAGAFRRRRGCGKKLPGIPGRLGHSSAGGSGNMPETFREV